MNQWLFHQQDGHIGVAVWSDVDEVVSFDEWQFDIDGVFRIVSGDNLDRLDLSTPTLISRGSCDLNVRSAGFAVNMTEDLNQKVDGFRLIVIGSVDMQVEKLQDGSFILFQRHVADDSFDQSFADVYFGSLDGEGRVDDGLHIDEVFVEYRNVLVIEGVAAANLHLNNSRRCHYLLLYRHVGWIYYCHLDAPVDHVQRDIEGNWWTEGVVTVV